MDLKLYGEGCRQTESLVKVTVGHEPDASKGELIGLLSHINSRLLHGIIGLNTESGEIMEVLSLYLSRNKRLDRGELVNLFEEVGDISWYLVGIVIDELAKLDDDVWSHFVPSSVPPRWLGVMSIGEVVGYRDFLPVQANRTLIYAGMGLAASAGKMLDVMKRNIFYGTELYGEKMRGVLLTEAKMIYSAVFEGMLPELGRLLAIPDPIHACLAANLVKLRKRYGTKFSAFDAEHRDLAAELEALQAGAGL